MRYDSECHGRGQRTHPVDHKYPRWTWPRKRERRRRKPRPERSVSFAFHFSCWKENLKSLGSAEPSLSGQNPLSRSSPAKQEKCVVKYSVIAILCLYRATLSWLLSVKCFNNNRI